jgi:hypothetical protein
MMELTELRVTKDDLSDAEIVRRPLPDLEEGEALVEVERFGLTANNVTYGLVGEQIGYWRFFPLPDAAGRGIVPAWGFGRVVSSRSEELSEGERLYGFFPMASHLVMRPRKKGAAVFDAAPHRASLPGTYNAYRLTAREPEYLKEREEARAVLFPLFATSFVIADWLEDNGYFGAERVVVTSASSKTGFGTAAALKRLEREIQVTGLTSAARLPFVRGLNLYDEVLSYEEAGKLDPSQPTALIDMSGNAEVITAIHRRLEENVVVSSIVGATHWDAPRQKEALPGAKPAMFFAPAQIEKRDRERGEGAFMAEALKAWAEITGGTEGQLTYETHLGGKAALSIWKRMVAGDVPADRGILVSLQESS